MMKRGARFTVKSRLMSDTFLQNRILSVVAVILPFFFRPFVVDKHSNSVHAVKAGILRYQCTQRQVFPL